MHKLKAFLLGMREFRLSSTWADPARSEDNDYTELDEAYDCGRELAHRLTLRAFDY
ncbi:hypothetical protein HGG72_08365 [Ochrobactrum pecoris]|uniref:HEPN domain-containing protein n=1 Tax=Brucella pecoris TaxID=867683 RepID=A0AB34YRS9_9HYPH|nr:hypothetical protein [Brucella pecoris]MBB4092441.1 hypothetical protein [Brucella pecoris]NKW80352.1 hypothetical protein [Brucella pecoris]